MGDDGFVSQNFRILGDVGASGFAVWITRHARRLGLGGAILHHTADQLELEVCGQPDMVDALALGCSLGPQEVLVEAVERMPCNRLRRDEFTSTSG